ncbi:AraC family transcriptional regulator ligand-binding domain-containing protein [Rhizobiaceae bacterium BDR2-2]|uniref:AraC family transcriptional regulator ligand-binding domain-containing protein n=1 Tax=Ectorhizobium quercum TaxID=2965071 RepID=A0AAE3N031_9HYPH|nr:AraC family transcriptional regulator [Ectorhizobium quercum]MCX8998523.1 AraC family transcriptional regulator ligand-binding domain-containing protein [Ectorhizobium quercum]
MAIAPHLTTKMPAIASIRASVLKPLVNYVERKTGKVDILLAEHGLLRSQMEDLYATVPMARYIAFFEAAAEVVRDPFLGARMGQAMTPGDLGPIGILYSLSPTLRTAFQRLSKYVNALQGGTASGLFEENGDVVWTYRLLDPALWPRRQDNEFSLAVACQIARACFGKGWRPLEVHFEHAAPRGAETLQRILRAPVLFGQSGNRLVIARDDADRPHRPEDRSLTAILERHVADLSPETDLSPSLTEKVMALIGIYLGHKPVTLAVVAAELKTSPRTLQRRLAEEGVSLRQLVQRHRRQMAELHLGHGASSRQFVAQSLGYADTTVLWRARRRWDRQDGRA